jgi:hypothetical protein
MTKRTKMTLAAGAAALALAGIGGGVAFASDASTPGATPTTAAAATTSTTTPAHPRKARSLWSRAEHGEVTLNTKKGDQVIDAQRGQVTAVSSTSVTVRSADGFTATYSVTGTSKIRVAKAKSTIANVHDGDRVSLTALRAGGTATVRGLTDGGAAKK